MEARAARELVGEWHYHLSIRDAVYDPRFHGGVGLRRSGVHPHTDRKPGARGFGREGLRGWRDTKRGQQRLSQSGEFRARTVFVLSLGRMHGSNGEYLRDAVRQSRPEHLSGTRTTKLGFLLAEGFPADRAFHAALWSGLLQYLQSRQLRESLDHRRRNHHPRRRRKSHQCRAVREDLFNPGHAAPDPVFAEAGVLSLRSGPSAALAIRK